MRKTVILTLVALLILSAAGCAGKLPSNAVRSADDLKGKTIGVVLGTPATVYADGYGKLHEYQSAETMLVDLKNGAIDCAVMEAGEAKAASRKVSGLKILSQPLVKADLCFAIAKENPDLKKAVNAALKNLSDSGLTGKIIEGYKTADGFRYTSPSNVDLSAGELTLVVSGKFPPYAYDDGKGNTVGVDIDIARAVCDILHVRMKITLAESGTLLTAVQYGKADFALGGITNNENDLKLVDFSASYAKTTQVIIIRR